MKYSFTFKGVSSDSFPWLIVSELPPITIPAVRYERVVIDGKDGDKTIPLGREAYDKNIFIGLSRGYDIDALAAWLNGGGELILSNEPDKKYIAEIVEQIDFERLVCFRTGTIVFHVQPYKLAVSENSVVVRPIASTGEVTVTNQGNDDSYPLISVVFTGGGTINVSLNGEFVFSFVVLYESTVRFDSESLDAYVSNNNLRTQYMSGDFIKLKPGDNVISFSMTGGGTVGKITVNPKSRWR